MIIIIIISLGCWDLGRGLVLECLVMRLGVV